MKKADMWQDPFQLVASCHFLPQLEAQTREAVLEMMVRQLDVDLPAISRVELLASVLRRERIRATGTPEGVAFPHGKHARIDDIYAVVATTQKPVDFGAGEAMPCRILILTVSSVYRADSHLQFLAHMARCLCQAKVRDAVLAAKDEHALIRAFCG
ncbi:MAG: PTS sugar transporter subunit IIA [Kiritimatiellia bacterium]